MVDYLDKFFNKPSAFDYFLKGQEARQNYDNNKQVMAQRQQVIDHAKNMNPELLNQIQLTNAAQKELTDHNKQYYPLVRNQATLSNDAQTELNRFNKENNPILTEGNKLVNTQSKLGIEQGRHDLFSSMQKLPLEMQNLRDQATTNRQTITTNNMAINAAKRKESQAIQDEQDIAMADTFVQYEKMAQENPEAAAQFIDNFQKEFEQKYKKPLDAKTFNPAIAGAKATLADQRSGNIQPVDGFPGLAYNTRTGKIDSSPEMMEKALKYKRDANYKPLDAKAVSLINKDLDKYIKPAKDISSAYNDLVALQANATPIAREAMITRLVQALDPTSTVSVTEGQIYTSSQGPAGQLASMWNNLKSEGKITETMMGQIVSTAGDLAKQRIKSSRESAEKFLNVNKDDMTPRHFNALEDRIPKYLVYERKQTETEKALSNDGASQYDNSVKDIMQNLGYKDYK